jgi:hypothetical protein
MIESRHITLNPGNVSLSSELGAYYIDMRPAIVHYTQNIWEGGFDADGVPMCGGPEGLHYSPVNIAQYGFMLHADWVETREPHTLEVLKRCIAVLDAEKASEGDACVWWHHAYEPKYGIEPPWASAMAQGEAISLYLRMYQALGDESLLDTAVRSYRFLAVEQGEGGVRRYDDAGDLWLEEFPSKEPSFVLNGFVYAVLGLYDLYRVTGEAAVKADIKRCLATLTRNLHRFDVGYWSLYDLRRRELVRYYYQKNVHVPQMEVLYRLTGDPIFEEYRARWARQVTPLNHLFVQIMYRVKPRLDGVRRLWNGSRQR